MTWAGHESERQRRGHNGHDHQDCGNQRITAKNVEMEGQKGGRNHHRDGSQSAQSRAGTTCGSRKSRVH
jgi:hypothetical protein